MLADIFSSVNNIQTLPLASMQASRRTASKKRPQSRNQRMQKDRREKAERLRQFRQTAHSLTQSRELRDSLQLPGLLRTTRSTITFSDEVPEVLSPAGSPGAQGRLQLDLTEASVPDEVLSKTQRQHPASQPQIANSGISPRDTRSAPAAPIEDDSYRLRMLRGYVQLMDNFSLHQFMIYHGNTLAKTPEFQSYKRTYRDQWSAIQHIIELIEELAQDHDIPLIVVDGKNLAHLASFELPKITKADMLSCMSNADQVDPYTRVIEGTGAKQRRRACIKIQAHARRYIARNRYLQLLERIAAATVIQANWRMHAALQSIGPALERARIALEETWVALQEKLAASWSTLQSRPHVVIHLPSSNAPEFVRLGCDRTIAAQDAHFVKLVDVVNPLVELAYISPTPVEDEMMQYNEMLFGVAGASHIRQRVKMFAPELQGTVPAHFPLSQVLWYSSGCLRRLKRFVARRPAYIMPSACGWVEKQLACFLNIPVYGCDPKLAEKVQTLSASKNIFAQANLGMPVGAHDLHSEEELLVALTKCICTNLEVIQWHLRLNVDVDGECTAVLDTRHIPCIQQLRHEKQALLLRTHGDMQAWFAGDLQLSARKRLMMELNSIIGRHTIFVSSETIPSWEWFQKLLSLHGGVIEAQPPMSLGEVCACVEISPTRECTYLFAADVLKQAVGGTLGVCWPQTQTVEAAVKAASMAVATSLAGNFGVIGCVTLRFTTLWDEYSHMPRLWASRIELGASPFIYGVQLFSRVCSQGGAMWPSDQDVGLTGRSMVFAPVLPFQNASTCTYDDFLKLCRLNGIAFDLPTQIGTLMFLVGNVADLKLNLLCIGQTTHRSGQRIMMRVLKPLLAELGKGHRVQSYNDNMSVLARVLRKRDPTVLQRLLEDSDVRFKEPS